ncbi:hypothetical protein ABW19_dt0203159 [Dactylella cylindrospora]|nr:hypothetical protein ABW19_dt0203159 [Dactylella cylindrospora]
MVLTKTPADFVERSIKLLQAHPNTARITTTYHISPPPTTTSTSKSRPKPQKPSAADAATPADPKPKLPRGKLTLKTYDPISGSVVKFKTDKISDVGRLVAGLHRLGRSMSGLADVVDVSGGAGGAAGGGGEAPIVGKDAVVGAAAAVEGSVDAGGAAAGGSGGGSKGGKKKKGKKK